MQTISKYFPNLTSEQYNRFAALYSLYVDWNGKINVISRKDIENLYVHHVLHSLAIARFISFKPETRIADIGTGGGFPGIPLAILFPQCHFTLIDSIGKKVRVASDIATQIGLKNVVCRHERVEEERELHHFIVSRAVMPLPNLYSVSHRIIDRNEQFNLYPNGIISLKGGDLSNETAPFGNRIESINIIDHFNEPFFTDKRVVYLQV